MEHKYLIVLFVYFHAHECIYYIQPGQTTKAWHLGLGRQQPYAQRGNLDVGSDKPLGNGYGDHLPLSFLLASLA